MDKLTATRYFLKVADTGSFSKTAKILRLPVSTVSRRIKDLELNLGVELFKRSTRFLSLTEIGRSYYNQVEDAVRAFDLAEEVATQTQKQPSGIIKISALQSYAEVHLYPTLIKFQKAYPEIIIDLQTTDVIRDIVRENIDFAFRPTTHPPENLIAKVIDDHNMAIIASPDYIKSHGKITDFTEVKNHKAICYGRADSTLTWYAKKQDKWSEIEKSPYFICSDTSHLLDIVINGGGISLLPEWNYKKSMEEGTVQKINSGWEANFSTDLEHRVYLLYDKKTSELTRNKLFLNFFMNYIKETKRNNDKNI